jgi:hypothetical protein
MVGRPARPQRYYGNRNADCSGCSLDAHAVTADPGFADALADDFTLLGDSPLVDAGTPTGEIATAPAVALRRARAGHRLLGAPVAPHRSGATTTGEGAFPAALAAGATPALNGPGGQWHVQTGIRRAPERQGTE